MGGCAVEGGCVERGCAVDDCGRSVCRGRCVGGGLREDVLWSVHE